MVDAARSANANAGDDPNPATAPTPNSQHIALENNASQVSDFAANDFPGDVASQAVEVATTLYFESNGVYNSVPYSASVNFNGENGSHHQYSATKVTENGLVDHDAEHSPEQLPDGPDAVQHLQLAERAGFGRRVPELAVRLAVGHHQGQGQLDRA